MYCNNLSVNKGAELKYFISFYEKSKNRPLVKDYGGGR